MRYYVAGFIILVCCLVAAHAQIIQFSGAPVPQGPGGGGGGGLPPVVTASSFSIVAPTTNNQFVGNITASQSPTNYVVASCAGCTNYFQFANPALPVMTVTPTGAANMTGTTPTQTFSPVVRASNATGNGQTTMTVTVTAPPIVTAGSYSIAAPAANGLPVGTIAATASPTSFSVTSCSGCTGYFTVSAAGAMSVTLLGSQNIVAAVYSPVVQATNATGSGSATQTVTATSSAPSVVSTNSFVISSPTTLAQSVGTVSATNNPANFQITSCPGCTGYFDIGATTGIMTVAAAGVTNINGTVAKQVFSPVVQAVNSSGTPGAATQTVTAFADGKPIVSVSCSPVQHPTALTAYGAQRPAWQVPGVDYCVGALPPVASQLNVLALQNSGCVIDPGAGGGPLVFNCASGSNIQGYHFFNNQAQVIVNCVGNNVIFKNNLFDTGAIFTGTSACTNLSFTNNTLSNASFTAAGANPTFEFNRITGPATAVKINGGGQATVKWNLIDGTFPSGTSWLTMANVSTTLVADFNTVYQATAGSNINGLALSGPLVNASDLGNNTFISLASAGTNYDVGIAQAGLTGTVSTHDNYADVTGAASFCATGSAGTNSTFSGNIKLTDGSTLTCAPLAPPVVTASTISTTQPVVAGPIGTVVATNSPTSWAITSCNNCSGFFTIPNGVLTLTSAGATAFNAVASNTTYSVTVVATNAGGNSNPVVITVEACTP